MTFDKNPEFGMDLAAPLEEKVAGAHEIIGMDPARVTAASESTAQGERPDPPPIHLP